MKLQDKLTEILGIEGFRVGDVVETLKFKEQFKIIDISDNDQPTVLVKVLGFSNTIFRTDEIKLISRDFTLAEMDYAILLSGERLIYKNLRAKEKMLYRIYADFGTEPIAKLTVNPTKSLFQQSKETINSIKEILL